MRRGIAWVLAALAALILLTAVTARPAAAAQAAAAAGQMGAAQFRALAAQAAPAPPQRTWTVRPGDTLSGIAARSCGTPADWPALAAASRIADGNQISPGEVIILDCAAAPASAAPRAAAMAGVPSGTLGCAGLEALWEDAGGSRSAAVTAAEIALAESGGRQYAYGPGGYIGYWQIAVSHGALATYSAIGNARAAVALSSDGADWYPWTTWTSGAYAGRCSGTVLLAVHTDVLQAAQPRAGPGPGQAALAWALAQAGKPYVWGGDGPYGYDCSGLVYAALTRTDPGWPPLARDTYAMLALAGRQLVQVAVPAPGDLAFFGTGHVEFWVSPGVVFGAQAPGTLVGFQHYGDGWEPTMFMRVT